MIGENTEVIRSLKYLHSFLSRVVGLQFEAEVSVGDELYTFGATQKVCYIGSESFCTRKSGGTVANAYN